MKPFNLVCLLLFCGQTVLASSAIYSRNPQPSVKNNSTSNRVFSDDPLKAKVPPLPAGQVVYSNSGISSGESTKPKTAEPVIVAAPAAAPKNSSTAASSANTNASSAATTATARAATASDNSESPFGGLGTDMNSPFRRSNVAKIPAPASCEKRAGYWASQLEIAGDHYSPFVRAMSFFPYGWQQPKTTCNNQNEGSLLKVSREGSDKTDFYICIADEFICGAGLVHLKFLDKYLAASSNGLYSSEKVAVTDVYSYVLTAESKATRQASFKRYGYMVGGMQEGKPCYAEEEGKIIDVGINSEIVVCAKTAAAASVAKSSSSGAAGGSASAASASGSAVANNQNSCGPNWAQQGVFSCENSKQVQKICGCNPDGYQDSKLWNNLGGGCFSHTTGKSCTTDFASLTTEQKAAVAVGIAVSRAVASQQQQSASGGQASCGPNWPAMGTFWCNGGKQHQRICGCNPDGFQDSKLWINEGGGCFSHTTGKSCSADHDGA